MPRERERERDEMRSEFDVVWRRHHSLVQRQQHKLTCGSPIDKRVNSTQGKEFACLLVFYLSVAQIVEKTFDVDDAIRR